MRDTWIARKDRSVLTQEKLKEHLAYDPYTGKFTRRIKLRGTKSAEGYVHANGYARICVLGKKYSMHRLAWFYVYGVWPEGQIDHINGVKTDNRITNLRDVDGATNSENQRRATVVNTSGLLGVCCVRDRNRRKPYQARIGVKGKSLYLGYFATPEEAHAAYVEAKRKYHAGCTI